MLATGYAARLIRAVCARKEGDASGKKNYQGNRIPDDPFRSIYTVDIFVATSNVAVPPVQRLTAT